VKPDPARVAAGWEPRFTAFGARAREMMRLYQALGFEVIADPLRPEDAEPGCDDCQLLARIPFVTIYTRRRA
jgi:hypothetical protein